MINLTQYNFFQKKKIAIGISICFLCFGGLTGCANDDFKDLRQYIDGVRARPKGIIVPLPEIKVVEPFIFNPDGLRDPFRPMKRSGGEDALAFSSGSEIKPQANRRKEELESYSLDTLRMVGTLTIDKGLWALIKASDGTIHRVQKGNHMGKNYGEIIRIFNDRIELMEIVSGKQGAWREQQASLALAESN